MKGVDAAPEICSTGQAKICAQSAEEYCGDSLVDEMLQSSCLKP